MKINNLSVDTEKIGAGLYDIICEKGEEAIVAFGMIPKWIIDLAEKLVREKIIKEAALQIPCSVEELAPLIDKSIVDDMTRKIMHEVTLGIYKAASDRGMMIV